MAVDGMKALRAIMPLGRRWRPLAAELGVLRTFSISERGVGETLPLSSSIGESRWAPERRWQSLLFGSAVGRPTPAVHVYLGLLVSGAAGWPTGTGPGRAGPGWLSWSC
jgi:hypothetical protein